MYSLLTQDVKYLPGVGPHRAMILRDELDVRTIGDLLYQLPVRYIDRSRVHKVRELSAEMQYVQLRGQIVSVEERGVGRKRRLEAILADETGGVYLTWFAGLRYAAKKVKLGKTYLVLGKPVRFNGVFSLSHPEIEEVSAAAGAESKDGAGGMELPGLVAVYRVTDAMKRVGLNSKVMGKLVATAWEKLGSGVVPDWMPAHLLAGEGLAGLDRALREAHRPSSPGNTRLAIERLKFDELFLLQLDIVCYAKRQNSRRKGYRFGKIGSYFMDFYDKQLPFSLTEAQKRVVREIRRDVGSGFQMNRLLQGDVGSGKTVVAVLAMLIALDNGFQSALMVPTEILAEQHFGELCRLLEPIGVKVGLLTGAQKGKARQEVLEGLKGGSVGVVVGTHALIEEPVEFYRLGFAVIDEQHRFGVRQRARLWGKSVEPPHVLVMTATPIPRTLAMTVYGDLEVSVIDELPPGRKPIRTLHFGGGERGELERLIEREVGEGRQVYVVYPLIKESERSELKNLEDGYERVKARFPHMSVGMLHGQMKPMDKAEVMGRFVCHELDILVATTVIEVGVNVPNASVMIIQDADRFGLAQLHQLRGRVGRGAAHSYCVLLTGADLGESSRRRIEIMCGTTDGFVLAEEDMKLRGPGDIEGTQQSGLVFRFRYANIVKDSGLMQHCRALAEDICKNDGWGDEPKLRSLRVRLEEYHNERGMFADIS